MPWAETPRVGIMAWQCLIRRLIGEVGGVSDFLSFPFELRSAEEILRTSSVPADELAIFTFGWSMLVVTSCFVAKSLFVISRLSGGMALPEASGTGTNAIAFLVV